jgi:hypothetical protein
MHQGRLLGEHGVDCGRQPGHDVVGELTRRVREHLPLTL